MIAGILGPLLGALVGFGVAAALWATAGDTLDHEALRRTNYRGRTVLTAAGILVVAAMVLVWGAASLVDEITMRWSSYAQLAGLSVLLGVGFGMLGLFDDVVGAGQSGGFRGHLRSMQHGRLSSGGLKMVAGAALAVAVVALFEHGAGPVAVLRDGAIVALAANAANLFDRAPGRTTKFATAAFVVAAVVARNEWLAAPAVGIGAALGLLRPEMGERIMLGDAGANPLGALCGLAWLVAVPSGLGRWLVLVVLVGLNVLSEVVSFSEVIERVPPLRWFDSLGRQAPPATN